MELRRRSGSSLESVLIENPWVHTPGSCPVATRGFREYLGVYIMSQLSQAGISLLNLGGSETAGMQNFKQKHAPIEERYMQMLVYGIE